MGSGYLLVVSIPGLLQTVPDTGIHVHGYLLDPGVRLDLNQAGHLRMGVSQVLDGPLQRLDVRTEHNVLLILAVVVDL